ncbi:MAG: hypothetical protein AB1705_17170 [Verrucomicrobiota bacterium]
MKDLTDPRWIYLKGFLFLFIGIASAVLVVLEHPTLKLAALLAIAIWALCRFYYFAFYVIQNYTDPSFKYSGLGSFVMYWLRKGRAGDAVAKE